MYLFAHAEQVVEITGEMPIVSLSLFRLVVAISARANAFEDGKFVPSRVLQYLSKHSDCFDILSPSKPFLQVKGLKTINAKGECAAKPINFLAMDKCTGSNVVFFDHSLDGELTLPLDQFTRWLITSSAFILSAAQCPTPEGKTTYPPTSNAAYGASFVVVGNNLSETLVLNRLKTSIKDVPSWERKPEIFGLKAQKQSREAYGPVDLITSPARAICIHDFQNGKVAKIHVTDIVQVRGEDPFWLMGLWSKTSKEDKPFQYRTEMTGGLPVNSMKLLPIAALKFPLHDPRARGLVVCGMATEKASIIHNQMDRISLAQKDFSKIDDAVKVAEAIKGVVYGTCGGGDAGNAGSNACEAAFWAMLLREFNARSDIAKSFVRCACDACNSVLNYTPFSILETVRVALLPENERLEAIAAKKERSKERSKTAAWTNSEELLRKIGKPKFNALVLRKKISIRGSKCKALVNDAEIASMREDRPPTSIKIAGITRNISKIKVDPASNAIHDINADPLAKLAFEMIGKTADCRASLMSELAKLPNGKKAAERIFATKNKDEGVKAMRTAIKLVPQCNLEYFVADLEAMINNHAETCSRLALEFVNNQ
jgi:hypothetical protein